MKKFFTTSALFKLLTTIMITGMCMPAGAQKTAMNFLLGQSYNLDVIIDGPLPGTFTTNWPYSTGMIDTIFSKTQAPNITPTVYNRFSLVSDLVFLTGLPAPGGTITSANPQNFTPTAPVYNVAPANVDNAMHLSNTTADTFMFTDSTLIGDIYLLGAAAGEPSSTGSTLGSSGGATVTILLKDPVTGMLSTQQTTGIMFPNYRDSSSSLWYAMSNIGRYNVQANLSFVSGDDGRPRLFDIRVPLQYANYDKRIRGVRVQKTSGDQIAVFGVCIDNNSCLPTASVVMDATPTPPLKITNTNPVRWRTVAGSQGYDVMLEAFPNATAAYTATTMPLYPGVAAVAQAGSFNTNPNDTVFTPIGLIPNTVYVLFVRSKCSATSMSVWNAVSFKTPDCAKLAQNQITYEVSATASRTTTSLRLKWLKQVLLTAASPTHIKFEYILNQDPNPPLPSVTGTQTTDTVVHFQNLKTCGLYYLWVRNNCTGNSWGPWERNGSAFQVVCCPSAGNPDTLAGSVSQTGFTMFWPGSKDSALTSYQYQLALNSPGSVDHNNWINTNDTFMVFPNINYPNIRPGQIYKFFVRSYCADTASAATPPSKVFLIPFYDCDTPGTPVVTNINMHGAQIDWTPGATAAPYPIKNYNVGITINNPNPPSTRAINQTTPNNQYFVTTTDTFYHPANLVKNTPYYVHIRTECDSVARNPSNSQNPNIIYKQSTPWMTTMFTTPDTCVPAIIPTISNVQATSAHIEWNQYYGIAGYEYYIDQQPNDPTTPGTWPLISFSQVDPINLFSGTDYWFHLRTKCNAIDYSPWTNTPFTTLSSCSSVSPAPALQSMPGNPGATSAIFNWAAVPYANAYDCAVTQSATPPAAPDATISITTYTAQGLIPSTNYYFHLKANCSPNDETSWVSLQFMTGPSVSVGTVENGVSVLVYPNPTNDDVTVDIQNNPKGTIQVLDMMGKVIYSTETTDKKTIINMKPFASGVYMIKYFVDAANMQMIRVQKI